MGPLAKAAIPALQAYLQTLPKTDGHLRGGVLRTLEAIKQQ
jgi:hypothetical protein